MLRIGGRKAAFLTFLGDILKGILPVLVAKQFGFTSLWLSAVVVAAFIGHCLPIFFSFNGGKGVATALGAVTAMNWQIGLMLLAVWALVFFIFRISSLAGIAAGLALPGATWFFSANVFMPMSIMALLMIWRHHDNIRNLLLGQEQKI